MANQEQLEILKQGSNTWNRWRKKNPEIQCDLSGAYLANASLASCNLSGAILTHANLVGANLVGADLANADLTAADLRRAQLGYADLTDANFYSARLSKANLSGANLTSVNLAGAVDLVGVNLIKANLTGANLTESDLHRANLHHANLQKANFENALFADTIFTSIDLSEVNGLEKAKHLEPSTIGTNTIQKSRGMIPIGFLRGCGLSDLEIEFAKLANPGLDPEQVTDITYKIHQMYLGDGFQYYSCFISYNSIDEGFAQRLHDDLQNNGVRCWFAPEDMKIGDQIRPTIDQQIRLRDKLLVILSENSVKSEWVGDEVEAALEEESASGRLVLFPIRLDDAVMDTRDDWAAKIKRRRHIGDFSNWEDEGSYQKAFERLLHDLKAH